MTNLTADTDLKRILIDKNLTETEVARRMGITRFYLSKLVNGKARWTLRTARDLSLAVGIPLATILGDGKGAE